MFKQREEIKRLKRDLDLAWNEILELRTQIEGEVFSPMRGYPGEPTLNGRVRALTTHLGLQFDIQRKSEKVIAKKGKK